MPLDRSIVLKAALEQLDEVGLDEFSTRKLAAALGVRVGALYWHYPSKQALLDAIAEHIAADATAAPLPDGDWAERLDAIARTLRDAMLAHTDGARVIACMSAPGPMAHAFFERLVAVLRETGLDADTAASAGDVLTSYVNGFTVEEQARGIRRQSRAERDRLFGFGVSVVIGGLRPLVGG
ncbi:TetR/AcrR family transcriptional regulator C-terminal domain-containing protein [Streptomyces sp. NPDC037389]|uniref:TetR/AcrR family transcriptional regulator C-terminal domain-containing protein n=1 Tax=Streptomyces sp. NPDC037389 TaxID=3155369 RepID=UPI003404401B